MAKTKLNGGAVAKTKSRNPVIQFDKLQMYFGEPYIIDLENCEGKIQINQPTIGDVVRFGEKPFYSTLSIFVTNTTTYRLTLWEMGLDWNEVSDFELFIMLKNGINANASALMFGDLDWSKFELSQKTIGEEKKIILYDAENGIEINEEVYFHISQYLRAVFNMTPEEKITTDKILRQWYITKDQRQKAIDKEKGEESTSIQSIISACVNHPGFKYNLEELKNVGVCQFYDSVKRIQVYENTTALLGGMYSGMIDSSHLKESDYNFMKNI